MIWHFRTAIFLSSLFNMGHDLCFFSFDINYMGLSFDQKPLIYIHR